MKQNDWIVANINNPNFTSADFKEVSGLNLNNTLFLDKEEYKKSKFITENPLFLNQNGTFNEKLFDDFYNYQVEKFNDFIENDAIYEKEYSFQDVRANADSKVRDFNFLFINVPNPDRVSFGVSGRNTPGTRKFSKLELAETQKIKDFETGKFLDKTPNDYALFRNPINYLFHKNLVLATYDEDTDEIDPITGIMMHHKKGDPKLNENGTYFTETLGGRSPRDKLFVTRRDLITVDGTKINKYDFLDTDNISKDPWKVVADTIASVLPLIVLGPYGSMIYSGLIVGREMFKSLPMLAGMTTSLADKLGTGINAELDFPIINALGGLGQSFSRGVSEYGKEHMFAFENFGNLISDVALQWGQQKAIILAISRLKTNNNKIMADAYYKAMLEYEEKSIKVLNDAANGRIPMDKAFLYTGTKAASDLKRLMNVKAWDKTPVGKAALQKFLPIAQNKVYKSTKLGQDLSLAYMAIISNTDVYEDALRRGATHKEAAAIALGSTIGMFLVDRLLGLGEMFFDDINAQMRREISKTLTDVSDDILKEILEGGSVAANKVRKPVYMIMKSAMDKTKNKLSKYRNDIVDRSLGFLGKATGEGLEEVAEEVVTDLTKSLHEIAADFGYYSVNDLGSWDNMLPRYAMNFIGGFLGGGMFYTIDAFNNPVTLNLKIDKEQLIYLIANGKTSNILNQLDKEFKRKSNIFGSYDLSISQDKDNHFITADEDHISQALAVYNIIKRQILTYDNILNNHNLKASDDELFDRLILTEAKFQALKDIMQDTSYFTGYQQNYHKLVNEIVDLLLKIDNKRTSDNIEDEQLKLEISQLETLLSEKLKQRDDFLSGKMSIDYLDKLMWMMDPIASEPYIKLTKDLYSRKAYGVEYDLLSDVEKKNVDQGYEAYMKGFTVRDDIDSAWKQYKEFRKTVSPILEEFSKSKFLDLSKFIEKETEYLKKSSEGFDFNQKLPAYEGLFGLFEEETDEEFQKRNKQEEGESDEDYNNRKLKRMKHLQALDSQKSFEEIQKFINNLDFIDSNTARRIQLLFKTRIKDMSDLTFNMYMNEVHIATNQAITSFTLKYFNRGIIQALNNVIKTYISKINFTDPVLDLDTLRVNIRQRIKDSLLKSLEQSAFDFNLLKFYTTDFLNYDVENEIPADIDGNIDETYTLRELKENQFFIKGTTQYEMLSGPMKESVDKIIEDLNITTDEKVLDLSLPILIEKLTNPEEYFSEDDNLLIDKFTDLLINNIIGIHENNYVEMLRDVSLKLSTEENPAVKVINAVIPRLLLNDEFDNLESALTEIHNLYQLGKTPESFELTDTQTLSLKNALSLLERVKGLINSATVEESLEQPLGLHKQLNKILKEHSDISSESEPLLEFDRQTGEILVYEIRNYESEINKWLYLSENNKGNRIAQINAREDALLKTLLKFFDSLKSIKLTIGDITVNLYDDFGETDETIESTIKIQNHIKSKFDYAVQTYIKENNVDKAKAVRDLYELIFDQNFFYEPKIDLVKQKFCKLGQNLDYNELSDYDKFIFLNITLLGNEVDLYNKLIDYYNKNTKQIPMFTQIFGNYIIDTHINNENEINEILDLIKNKYKINVPVLYNTTIITGLAGTGKTSAEAKFISDRYKSDEIAVAGPSITQSSNLSELIGNLKPEFTFKSLDDLINHFINPDLKSKIEAELKNLGNRPKYPEIFDFISIENDQTVLAIKSESDKSSYFKNLKDEEIPKVIIIDEATYFAHPYIHLFSILAKLKGIHIILIGDEAQTGHISLSIEKEMAFAIRTPRLELSMRTENVHQNSNQKRLSDIFEKYVFDEYNPNEIWNSLSSVQFKYFLSDTDFTGTVVLDLNSSIESYIKAIKASLEKEILEKRKILFVGENGPIFLKLKDSGINVEQLSETDIQGLEAPYAVIDVNWKKEYPYEVIRRLNTLITRSKKGTILIDNGLTSIINSSEQSTINTEIQGFSDLLKNQIRNEFFSKLEFLKNFKPSEIELTIEENKEQLKEETAVGTNLEIKPEEKSKEIEIDLKDGTESFSNDSDKLNLKKQEKEYKTSKGYRFYGNITTLGTQREELPAERSKGRKAKYKLYKWIAPLGTNKRDVGIIMKQDVIKGSEKESLVYKIETIKGFLAEYFSLDNRADREDYLRRALDKFDYLIYDFFGKVNILDLLENAKFYVESKTLEDGYDSYVGLTTANDKVSVEETPGATIDIGGEQKFVRVYIEYEADGETRQITLGTVANPKNWRSKILDALSKAEHERTGEKQSDIIDRMNNEVDEYENKLNDLKNNPLVEIDPITFTGNVEFYPLNEDIRVSDLIKAISNEEVEEILNVDGKYIVLKRSDSDEFKRRLSGKIVSDIHIITDKSDPLAGKAVIYVATNPVLNKNELMGLYNRNTHKVRMIVLNNLGIDFTSLTLSKWEEIYKGTSTLDSAVIPNNLRQFGARMYQCMWNFRARLIDFLAECDNFEKKYNIKFSDNNVQNLLIKEGELYKEYKEKNIKVSFDEYIKDNISAEEYDLYNEIKKFNEETLQNNPEFRVGTDSNKNGGSIGLYVRTLVNSKDKPWAKPKKGQHKKDVFGIYINPLLAHQYLNVLNKLFEEILKIVIPAQDVKPGDIINLFDKKDGDKTITWFSQVKAAKLQFTDESGDEKTFDIAGGTISILPLKMKEIYGRARKYAGMGALKFKELYDQGKFKIGLTDLHKNDLGDIDFLSIFDQLEGGLRDTLKYDIPQVLHNDEDYEIGITPWFDENGDSILGYKDRRLKNLFKIMFHGLTWTKTFNDFTGNEPRAYVADFKYGIFVDALIHKDSTSRSDMAALSSSDTRFFSIDVIPGLSIGYFNFYKTEKQLTQVLTISNVLQEETTDPKIQEVLKIIPQFKDTLSGFKSLESFRKALNDELSSQFSLNLRVVDTSNYESLYLYLDKDGNLFKLVDYIKNKLDVLKLEFIGYSDEGTLLFKTDKQNCEFNIEEFDLLNLDDNSGLKFISDVTPDQKIESQQNIINQLIDVRQRLKALIDSLSNGRMKNSFSNMKKLLQGEPTVKQVIEELIPLTETYDIDELNEIFEELNEINSNNENACLIPPL